MATLYAYSPNGTQATLPVNVMGFTQSLATNGWCKLPNGLIFQWGRYSSAKTYTFPVSFSTRVGALGFINYVSGAGNASGQLFLYMPTSISTSSVTCQTARWDTGGGSMAYTPGTTYVTAIGN